jgi:signal transduction histidine kinase
MPSWVARAAALRREAEAALRTREAFLTTAAHELRTPLTSVRAGTPLTSVRAGTPLTSVRAGTQFLLRALDRGRGDLGQPDPERSLRILRLVDLQSRQLGRLISQLLTFTRTGGTNLELDCVDTELVALVRNVVDSTALTASRHEFQVQAPASLHAHVDPSRIEQVLSNLLGNAVKYSPAGGAPHRRGRGERGHEHHCRDRSRDRHQPGPAAPHL